MSDKYVDPSGDTEAFRAFANDPQAPAGGPSKLPMIVGAVVALLVVLLVAWFLLG
ncbi:hypothetical protein [Micromonospora echinofusca]|uniref:hypothetical protein n=1 Tax=Micromonospora echinofusca TaxID=47858 RepID=UPI001AD635FB|nr:hypothetical protein [Micromonospora echinofusca]